MPANSRWDLIRGLRVNEVIKIIMIMMALMKMMMKILMVHTLILWLDSPSGPRPPHFCVFDITNIQTHHNR